jgi:hypothetical protein
LSDVAVGRFTAEDGACVAVEVVDVVVVGPVDVVTPVVTVRPTELVGVVVVGVEAASALAQATVLRAAISAISATVGRVCFIGGEPREMLGVEREG